MSNLPDPYIESNFPNPDISHPTDQELVDAINDNDSRTTTNETDISTNQTDIAALQAAVTALTARVDTLETDLAVERARIDSFLAIEFSMIDELPTEKGEIPTKTITLEQLLAESTKPFGYHVRKDGKKVYGFNGKKARVERGKIVYDKVDNPTQNRILTLIGFSHAINSNAEANDKLIESQDG